MLPRSRNCHFNPSRGFHQQTQSLWLTAMAHHHLAIAFIFLIVGHMHITNFGIGHSMKDLLDAHIPPGGRLGRGHKGLYDTINNWLSCSSSK
ncbi:putative photosystem I [Helianthus anomalus]